VVENDIAAAAPLHVIPSELSRDLGKRRVRVCSCGAVCQMIWLSEESEGDNRFHLSHHDEIVTIQLADSTDEMQLPHPIPSSSDPFPASFLARLAGFAHLFTRQPRASTRFA
jgi:hypothetical protein